MARRTRVVANLELHSLADCDGALKTIADNKNTIESEKAKYNKQEHARREKLDQELAPKKNEVAHLEKQLEMYAEKHREEVFGKKKSVKLTHGTLSWRLGTKKVLQRKRFTTAKTLELIGQLPKKLAERYTKVAMSVKKAAIIEDYNNDQIDDETLQKIGVEVVQEETFGYDIDEAYTSS